ncbi:Cna B-type domain-containing protein [Streptococcus oralis]|uniref:Cna B-type domain-containing protein n=1 Tax=Streptococcus oralis TaxID=1303 RepID=UPI002001C19A|nr:Cna B-type domain-containing protein [Streptococcus oralis]
MKNKKFWLPILTSLACLLGIIFAPNSVQAKELKNVISNIGIWEVDNGKFIKPDANGVYTLSPEHHNYSNYKFTVDYDLSAYDGKLEDGDTFTFTVPSPLTVRNETFDLKDKETDLVIGETQIVSNGDNNGGKATITLKNLKTYLEKKGGYQVQNVKGNFFVGFSSKNELSNETLRFDKTETINEITHQIKVKKGEASDYSEGIGRANFSKYHGLIYKEDWTSSALNKSGQYLHSWYVRANPKQAAYNKIEIHDWVDPNASPMQMIPETFKVTAGWYDKSYYFKDEVVLEAGKDYQVKWNDSYTEFTLTINNASSILAKNGKPAAFRINYKTSAPADGTQVQNNAEMKGDDQILTYDDYSNKTVVKQIGNSVVASGGTIQLETGYRIILYKVDELTHDRLKGAKFKITPPAGATAKEEIVTTNDDGIAESSIYSESDIKKGNFTVTEIEAPEGYELNPTPFEMTVGKDGAIRTVTNKRNKVKAQIQANKKMIGRELKEGEYEFTLIGPDGKTEVETVKNAADGSIKFAELSFDAVGEYTYRIVEKKAGTTDKGVTYDVNPVVANVKVTSETGTSKLKTVVTYENDDNTFENTYTPKKTSAPIEVTKVLTGRTLKADEFEFVLKNDADGSEVQKVKNTADGKVTFAPLEYTKAGTYKYTIVETNAGQTIDGVTYDSLEVKVTVEVTDDGEGNLTANVTYPADKEFNNSYGASKTPATLAVKKTLTGRELKADEFEFTLTDQDGNVKETVKNDKDGNVKFSALEFDKAGTFTYKIAEKAGTATGITYDTKTITATVTVTDNGKGGLEATVAYDDEKAFENTYTPAKTEVPVKKVWKDENNQDGKRPTSVTVKLLADGQDTGETLTLTEANGWAGSFTNLDADKGGTPIKYTVVEVTVTGYTSKVTGDAASGFTITNSYSPETVDVKATKNWDDANNQDGKRPTKITINLLADGQKVDSKEVQAAADGTWTVEFMKLAKYKAGKKIKYTVTEEAVAEYESTITDFTITNKYAPKAIDYKVTKVWNDANNQDGKRPESVTVQLYKKVGAADPVAVEGKKLTLTAKDKTDANTWVASFTNLPQYEAGKEITYSIKEVDVPAGYEASVTGQVVTNTHNPDTVILSGTKVWKDNNNQDGKRTTSVKVQILKNDKEVVQEIEVSEATGWKFESKALPKYENGKLIKYTVKEVVVKGYTSTITTEKEGKYTITNEYTPEKIAVSGQKTWIDNNDQDRIRPASITVKLLANGKETGQEATATAETGWKYEFTNLDRYQNGKPIEYTVKEVGVPTGYTATETGMNVTNTHTPEKTSVKGKKIWKGDENHKDARPASITVKLFANGKDTGKTAIASEASGWTYEFTDLDRYQEGKEIAYTVEEVNVPDGYTASVEGYNITNTHTPEKPTPGKPNEPGKPKKGGELPNTGSKSNQVALVAGIALLGLGTGFLARRKKED